jgi:hypothetical protein
MIVTISLIVLAVIIFILVTPLILEIDTTTDIYRLQLVAIASVQVVFVDGLPQFRIWVLGWHKQIDPVRIKGYKKNKKKETSRRNKRNRSAARIWQKVRAVLRSFTVQYFEMDIDTDDYAANAVLYPIALAVSGQRTFIRINFDGRTSLKCKITNCIGKILFAFTQ